MATCILFAEQLDDEQCLSIVFDQNDQVIEPLAKRPLSEIRALQSGARTIVVLPSVCSSFHRLDLPWLSERKSMEAIPYALEEELAQSVSTLHFSFERQYYQNNQYLVVVTDKQYLVDVMAKLDQLSIDFQVLTLDWFALKENEACVTEDGLLVYDKTFIGALPRELATEYLERNDKNSEIFYFNNSMSSLKQERWTTIDDSSFSWIAARLLKGNMMNLCQGDLLHDNSQKSVRKWYYIACAMFGVLIVSVLLCKGISLYMLNREISALDKKIAVIYREFFPESKTVISPKFRIEQLLKSNLGNENEALLWILLSKLGKVDDVKKVTIEQFRFQGKVLSVTLAAPDFSTLEHLELSLQKAHVKVTQQQASSQEHQVIATLELKM